MTKILMYCLKNWLKHVAFYIRELFNIEGINEWRYTLSEIGHPCSFDPTRNDCAWCTYGKSFYFFLTVGKENLVTKYYFNLLDGFQCGNFTTLPSSSHEHGKYCKRFNRNHKQCYGTSKCDNYVPQW